MLTRNVSDDTRAFAVACLLYVCVIFLWQASYIVDPSYFHELHRAFFRYYPLQSADLFAGDYLTSIARAFPHPYLYEGLTSFWLWAGGDLITLHRLLPLACWAVFLTGTAMAARRLGDGVTLLGVLCVVVAQPVYLYHITGASPHAFAFPLLIWGLVALLHGSARGLAMVTLISGFFYTAMTPLLGLLLAWQLLFAGRFLAQPRREQVKALALLAVTGVASLALVFASLKAVEGFGALLEPMEKVDVYPENGPEGRYFYGVFHPLGYVVIRAIAQLQTPNSLQGLLVVIAYTGVALYGLATLPKGGPRRALFAFIAAAALLGLAIFLLKPFHAYRYALYPTFTVLPLVFMTGLQRIASRLASVVRRPQAFVLGVIAFLALVSGSLDYEKLGYRWHLESDERQVMDFAAARPPATLFAVWPSAETPLELIPYVARRPLFVMRKTHYTLYEGHILAMRARTDALIDAYLATDLAPLRRLHCRWRVDYLVVEKAYFRTGEEPPDYFAPFRARVEQIWRSHRREDFAVNDPGLEGVVLENAAYRVVDLAALAGPGCGAIPEDPGAD